MYGRDLQLIADEIVNQQPGTIAWREEEMKHSQDQKPDSSSAKGVRASTGARTSREKSVDQAGI